ncbi:MAG: hypothetical protein HC810_04035 [Acaryochloridaceae cyanobacterium RL_2_7]|nr:hypothetical protein [Acaryochloridaceae cyanobacterium RL_2_7]
MSRPVDSSPNVRSSQDSATLSDDQLISAFIDGVIRGEQPLQANKNLRIEPVFQSLQLLSNREGMIATVNLRQIPIQIDVHQGTSFSQQVHEKLFEQSYLPLHKLLNSPTYCYRFCEVPQNYQVYCTTVKELWRASWGRGFGLRSGIPLDLIVWYPCEGARQEPWQSLMGMDCDRGQLVVKMLGHAVALDSTDLVVWAKAVNDTPRIRAQAYRRRLRESH